MATTRGFKQTVSSQILTDQAICCHSIGFSPLPRIKHRRNHHHLRFCFKNHTRALIYTSKLKTTCFSSELPTDGLVCARFLDLARREEGKIFRVANNHKLGQEMKADDLPNFLQNAEATTEDESLQASSSFNSLRVFGKYKPKMISKSKLKGLQKQQKEKERLAQTDQSFSSFYQSQYGSRWPMLLQSLLSEPRSSCLLNFLSDTHFLPQTLTQVPAPTRVPFLKLPVYEYTTRFPRPERDSQNLYTYYLLDAASVLVAEALDIQKGDRVLDLCAAPGGKTLAILQQLEFPGASITANEPCKDRRRRLWKVITDYVPKNLKQHVRITGHDGVWWNDYEVFDKVLVDAPCSSERHLLHDQGELMKWTQRRSTHCAKRQLAFLATALKCVEIGGLVVYSTCSISKVENDDVIAKVTFTINSLYFPCELFKVYNVVSLGTCGTISIS